MAYLVGESSDPAIAGVTARQSAKGPAVWADSSTGEAVHAQCGSSDNAAVGAYNNHPSGTGAAVFAVSHSGPSVHAQNESAAGSAILAFNVNPNSTNAAIYAHNKGSTAVHAHTESGSSAALAAYNVNPSGTGAAVFGKKEGASGHAGFFDGNVWVSRDLGVGGDIKLANADCAEDFEVAVEAQGVESGTVMVVGEGGALHESVRPYDTRVAGVISGAGEFRPGIVLDRHDVSGANRRPIALLGKVYCKVDSGYGSIEVGDLLTTCATPGHAMKVDDPIKAIGAVIGKSLIAFNGGQGLIPILVTLQ